VWRSATSSSGGSHDSGSGQRAVVVSALQALVRRRVFVRCDGSRDRGEEAMSKRSGVVRVYNAPPGVSASAKKAAAARRNGKLGGRPATTSPEGITRNVLRVAAGNLRALFVEVGNMRSRLLQLEAEGRRIELCLREQLQAMTIAVPAGDKS